MEMNADLKPYHCMLLDVAGIQATILYIATLDLIKQLVLLHFVEWINALKDNKVYKFVD